MLAGAVTSGIHVRRAQADEYFDPQALEITADQQQASDLSYFSRQGGQQPGRYRVAVVVNQTQRDEREIAFVDTGGTLSPVLNLAYLKRLGVNIAAFSSFDALHDEETFTDIGKYIPDASTHFDFTHHQLVLSIPQAAMLQKVPIIFLPNSGTTASPLLLSITILRARQPTSTIFMTTAAI